MLVPNKCEQVGFLASFRPGYNVYNGEKTFPVQQFKVPVYLVKPMHCHCQLCSAIQNIST